MMASTSIFGLDCAGRIGRIALRIRTRTHTRRKGCARALKAGPSGCFHSLSFRAR